ncbi:MAG: HNH endonuclease [bacterium]|nr:HNH endonuclease [bacterium]
MLRTCSVCGGIHEEDKMCKRLYNKKIDTKAVSFRNSYDWRIKRTQIRVRDMFLCQVCLKEKHDTNFKYNHNHVQIHHIIPIEEDFSKRLDDNNLICLCSYHHRLAEDGIISCEELKQIIQEKE